VSALVWLPVLFVVFAPLRLLGRGRPRVGRAAIAAFGPAVLAAIAALIASRTAWGHREVPNDYSSHTAELVLWCIVLTVAGLVGMIIAGLGYASARGRSARTARGREG
jgi:hypothetical protein